MKVQLPSRIGSKSRCRVIKVVRIFLCLEQSGGIRLDGFIDPSNLGKAAPPAKLAMVKQRVDI